MTMNNGFLFPVSLENFRQPWLAIRLGTLCARGYNDEDRGYAQGTGVVIAHKAALNNTEQSRV